MRYKSPLWEEMSELVGATEAPTTRVPIVLKPVSLLSSVRRARVNKSFRSRSDIGENTTPNSCIISIAVVVSVVAFVGASFILYSR